MPLLDFFTKKKPAQEKTEIPEESQAAERQKSKQRFMIKPNPEHPVGRVIQKRKKIYEEADEY